MFNSILSLIEDTVKVADAAVEIPLGITRAVTKPIGDAAQSMKQDVFEALDLDED